MADDDAALGELGGEFPHRHVRLLRKTRQQPLTLGLELPFETAESVKRQVPRNRWMPSSTRSGASTVSCAACWTMPDRYA